MDQNMIQQAYMLEKQTQELEENLAALNNEIQELNRFKEGIEALESSREKKILSSIGKGVYVKAQIEEKELYVEIGKGLVLKKSHKETKELIEKQISKMDAAREQIAGKIDIYREVLSRIIEEVGKETEKEEK